MLVNSTPTTTMLFPRRWRRSRPTLSLPRSRSHAPPRPGSCPESRRGDLTRTVAPADIAAARRSRSTRSVLRLRSCATPRHGSCPESDVAALPGAWPSPMFPLPTARRTRLTRTAAVTEQSREREPQGPAESRLQSVTGGFRSVYFSSARLCAKLVVNGLRLSKSTISLLLVLGHVLQRRNTHFNFTGFELCPGEPRTLGQGLSLRDAAGYRLSSKDTSAHPILRKLPDLELLCKKSTTRRIVIGVSSGRAYLYTTAPFNCPSSASLSQLRKCLDREGRST